MDGRKSTTEILSRVTAGDPTAYDELLPIVYEELRNLARWYMRDERRGHTLQPTALLHEAYLRLVGQTKVKWQNRAHFIAVAAQAMRRVLVDHARARKRMKRGGNLEEVSLDQLVVLPRMPKADLVAMDLALEKLSEIDARKAQVVELLFFAGLTVAEAAKIVGVSRRTVTRDWQYARVWLHREMTRAGTAARKAY